MELTGRNVRKSLKSASEKNGNMSIEIMTSHMFGDSTSKKKTGGTVERIYAGVQT